MPVTQRNSIKWGSGPTIRAASIIMPDGSRVVPKVHVLKTWPRYFAAVESGAKPFEVRQTDRDFRLGDQLLLAEWQPRRKRYTGRTLWRKITFILPGGQFGVEDGACVMGLTPVGIWEKKGRAYVSGELKEASKAQFLKDARAAIRLLRSKGAHPPFYYFNYHMTSSLRRYLTGRIKGIKIHTPTK